MLLSITLKQILGLGFILGGGYCISIAGRFYKQRTFDTNKFHNPFDFLNFNDKEKKLLLLGAVLIICGSILLFR